MFTSVNPATGVAAARWPEHDDAEVEARVAAVAAAYGRWRVSPLAGRAALLRACADRFEADKERLAAIAVREMGKTFTSAVAEVERCVSGFRFYAEQGPALLAGGRLRRPAARWAPAGCRSGRCWRSGRRTPPIGRWSAFSRRPSSPAMSAC